MNQGPSYISSQLKLPFFVKLLSKAVFLATAFATVATAAVRVSSPFGDHMVLQSDQPLPVWGFADPGEEVTVTFAGNKSSTTADPYGNWALILPETPASHKPRNFKVKSSNTARPIVFMDVLVGEVWVCGGQSNMERQLGLRGGQQPIENWKEEVANAKYPQIRQLYVPQTFNISPQREIDARWTVCSPDTAANFTAVGFFFARKLHEDLGVPVGIIHSSRGGTPAESWTSGRTLETFPEFKNTIETLREEAKDPVGTNERFQTRVEKWYRSFDPGSGENPWYSTSHDDSDWETMRLPVRWENAGHEGFDGVAWFRKSFTLPPDWEQQDLFLSLSQIDDYDTAWVNGIQVGSGSGWQTNRRYRIPADTLKQGKNNVTVRVLDISGGGGIWNPQAPFHIQPIAIKAKPISLKGEWKAKFSNPILSNNRPPAGSNYSPYTPSALYNAMINPLIPYAIKGVAFYQGEANAKNPKLYQSLLPALIHDWRAYWGKPDLPFLFVQIAPFKDQPPEIREAQRLVWQSTPNTAMIVTIDVGDANDIHPTRKRPVGERLALAARAVAYHEDIVYSGPAYMSVSFDQGQATLEFEHVGKGLVAQDGPLRGFSIAGSDQEFHPAEARIEGNSIIVHSPKVAKPSIVRYAWANVADGNLFNSNGLPASPFSTNTKITSNAPSDG